MRDNELTSVATAVWTRLERECSPTGSAGYQWVKWCGLRRKELPALEKLVTPWHDGQTRSMWLLDGRYAVAIRRAVASNNMNDLSRRTGIYAAYVWIMEVA